MVVQLRSYASEEVAGARSGGMSTIAGNISEVQVENISGGNMAEVEAGLAMLALESFLSGEELMVWLANQSRLVRESNSEFN